MNDEWIVELGIVVAAILAVGFAATVAWALG